MFDLRRHGPTIALTTAIMLLLGSLWFLVYIDRVDRGETVDRVQVQADILASTLTAALSFDDRQAAQEYVAALAADPDVRAVGIYDVDGALFARYTRTPEDTLPRTPGPLGNAVTDDHLRVVVPIERDAKAIGRVYIETAMEAWPRRLERYGVIAILLVMAALSAAMLAGAQRALTRANAELERRARELTAANASLKTEMAERAKAEEALRQAQKMEVIGQLTGGVAHDFNNLLQVILGNLDTIRRRSGKLTDLQRPLDAAVRGAERAAVLTGSLLAFARRQPLAPKPLDVNQVASAISELLHRTLGHGIKIETVLSPGLWRIAADASQLDTALVNLAVNARDAMPDGGKLVIATRNARLAAGQMPEEVPPGDYVQIEVGDTGSGMTPEVIERAFEPFYTTKDIGKGSGLGLSQVYGFIRQSGGHAAIDSAPGQGTRISLYLPRLDDPPPVPTAAVEAPPVPRGRPDELVLVVEDEPEVRDYVVQMIRELGYGVAAAGDGPSALALLAREPRAKLLFTDIGLPGEMNGRQLADAVAAARPHLPILFTTGYARDAIVYRGTADAGMELIVKPFTYAGLGAKLRQILDRPPG